MISLFREPETPLPSRWKNDLRHASQLVFFVIVAWAIGYVVCAVIELL